MPPDAVKPGAAPPAPPDRANRVFWFSVCPNQVLGARGRAGGGVNAGMSTRRRPGGKEQPGACHPVRQGPPAPPRGRQQRKGRGKRGGHALRGTFTPVILAQSGNSEQHATGN